MSDKKCFEILMPKSGADFHTSLHCWQIYVKLCVCRLWGREVASFCNGKAPQWLPVITILDNCDFNLGSFLITNSLKSQFLRWQQFVTICEYSLPVIIMPMRRTLRYYNLLFKLLTFRAWCVVRFVTNFVGFMINIMIHVDDEGPH